MLIRGISLPCKSRPSAPGLYIIEDAYNEEHLRSELSKLVPASSIVTFDLRPQTSPLLAVGVVVISK